jgi:hypothetical protein
MSVSVEKKRIMNGITLSQWQRVCLRLFGNVEVGVKQQAYGVSKLYAFMCPDHGLQTDTPHGYSEYLYCPVCEKLEAGRRFQR